MGVINIKDLNSLLSVGDLGLFNIYIFVAINISALVNIIRFIIIDFIFSSINISDSFIGIVHCMLLPSRILITDIIIIG